jgi:hypothetical protein
MLFIFNRLLLNAETGTGEAGDAGKAPCPVSAGPEMEDTMKTSMLIKIVASLAIGAAFPLGAIAAQPAKTTTERGVIEKAETPKVKAARKHYFVHGWMDS